MVSFLRQETSGRKLLLLATVVALVWANLAGSSYDAVWDASAAFGPGWLHLDLTLGGWATDGLLAIFFFVAGLELKRASSWSASSPSCGRRRCRSSRRSPV